MQGVADRVQELDVSRNQLTSLLINRVQHFCSLQQVDASRNRLVDVSGLVLLLQLRVLILARNKLRDLQPLQVQHEKKVGQHHHCRLSEGCQEVAAAAAAAVCHNNHPTRALCFL